MCVVKLVSPLCVYIYIYSPSVYLVLCELLNVMVLFDCYSVLCLVLAFIVCSSFSIKHLHIDPCLCLFSPASPQR